MDCGAGEGDKVIEQWTVGLVNSVAVAVVAVVVIVVVVVIV